MSTLSLEERLAQMGRDLREELSDGKELTGSFFCRMGKLFVEELLGAEVGEALGRDKGQRRAEGQAGYRNGYKARELRTGEGPIEVAVPQVRGLGEPYRSAIWQGLGKRSASLEKLAVEMYARGLSTRDIEDLLKELSDDGQTTLLSRSAVSHVTEALTEQYEAFTRRDLSGFDVVYLFGRRGLRVAETAGVLQAGGAGHVGHPPRRQQGPAAHGPGQQGESGRLARPLPQPREPRPADAADGHQRRGAGPDQSRRGDVARGRAHPLLVPQDEQRPGQGA